MRRFRTKLRAADIVAAVLLAAFSLILMPVLAKERPADHVIVSGIGDDVIPDMRFSLSEDTVAEIRSGKYTLVLVIEGGKARISESDCPGHDCVRSGPISKAGESIICIHAGISVTACAERSSGDGAGGTDGIAG